MPVLPSGSSRVNVNPTAFLPTSAASFAGRDIAGPWRGPAHAPGLGDKREPDKVVAAVPATGLSVGYRPSRSRPVAKHRRHGTILANLLPWPSVAPERKGAAMRRTPTSRQSFRRVNGADRDGGTDG